MNPAKEFRRDVASSLVDEVALLGESVGVGGGWSKGLGVWGGGWVSKWVRCICVGMFTDEFVCSRKGSHCQCMCGAASMGHIHNL